MVVEESSASAPVTSAIPEGSVLGPILFLCDINDLLQQVSSQCYFFADDSILYREIKKSEDSKSLQDDLAVLEAWEKQWGMEYYPDKCVILRIIQKRKPLETSYTLRGHQTGNSWPYNILRGSNLQQQLANYYKNSASYLTNKKGNAKASQASQHYRSMKAFTQRAIRKAYWQYVEGIVTASESGEEEKNAPTVNKKL